MQLRYRQQVAAAGVSVAALALVLGACSSSSSSSSSGGSSPSGGGSSSGSAALSGTLNASGSTLQLVYEQAAISAFKSVQSGMTVNYGGGGSGKGRTDLASGVVNFAGSDSPIPAKETANFKGKAVLYYPILIAPITVSYNLSGVSNLKLSGPTIAGIFEGKIKTWNDAAIKADNPGASLPSTAITVAHRSDSSGTTQNFSQFLVDAGGSAWTLGSNSVINWPAATRGGSGNAGVSQIIKSTPGAIGYVDYADAKASGLVFASIKNKDGQYVAPSTTAASASGRPGLRQARPDLQRDLGARSRLLPDHRSVVGSGLPDPAERERREATPVVHRLPGRRRSETAPRSGLRAAARQHRLDGQGGSEQDRHVMMRIVTHADQPGYSS